MRRKLAQMKMLSDSILIDSYLSDLFFSTWRINNKLFLYIEDHSSQGIPFKAYIF